MPTVSVVRARLSLVSTAEGGRQSPVSSGYRATVFLRTSDPLSGNDALLNLEEQEVCQPGEDCVVQLIFLSPDLVQDILKPGAAFQLKEGLRVVGIGKVMTLVKSA